MTKATWQVRPRCIRASAIDQRCMDRHDISTIQSAPFNLLCCRDPHCDCNRKKFVAVGSQDLKIARPGENSCKNSSAARRSRFRPARRAAAFLSHGENGAVVCDLRAILPPVCVSRGGHQPPPSKRPHAKAPVAPTLTAAWPRGTAATPDRVAGGRASSPFNDLLFQAQPADRWNFDRNKSSSAGC